MKRSGEDEGAGDGRNSSVDTIARRFMSGPESTVYIICGQCDFYMRVYLRVEIVWRRTKGSGTSPFGMCYRQEWTSCDIYATAIL